MNPTSRVVHIALVRGINVGGHRHVAMADLRAMCGQLGLDDARSLLQNGNLLFRCAERPGARLERLLEVEAEKRLGLRADFLVRTAVEWTALVARNPFRQEVARDPAHLVVMCMKAAPRADDVNALQAAIVGREVVRADDRQLYMVYPDGIGRSRFTSALIEQKLGVRGTARNWNTVLKLAALVGG